MTLVCLPGPLGFLWALRLLSLHPGPGHTNGSVAHVLYCAATAAADPVMPRRGVVFQGLCQLDVFLASAVARPVPVSGSSVRVPTPIVIPIPRDLQSSCARSMLGLCPLRSDRNASSGRPASLAARLVPQPRCFSWVSTSSASWRLAGPAGFLFIRVFTSVLHVAVFRCVALPTFELHWFRAHPVPVSSPWAPAQGARSSVVPGRPLDGGTSRSPFWVRRTCVSCVFLLGRLILLAGRAGFWYARRRRVKDSPATACSPWGFDGRPCWIRGGAE